MEENGPEPKVLIADRGYDADFIRDDMETRGGATIIPMKRNRKVQIPIDGYIYALRNQVERCFNKMKNARRLATRYDKTESSYLGFVQVVSIRLWTKHFVNSSYAFFNTNAHIYVSHQIKIQCHQLTAHLVSQVFLQILICLCTHRHSEEMRRK